MTKFEKFKIAAQVALEWERENYQRKTSAQMWDMGYDSEGDVFFLGSNEYFQGEAIASVDMPHLVEVSCGVRNRFEFFTINMETGEIQNA